MSMPTPSLAWNDSPLKALLGIEVPIIQGPMGGFATQRLSAAVSNFGGLGSFGAHGLAPKAIQQVIDELRALTKRPFAINLWVSMEDEGAFTSDAAAFARSLAVAAPHLRELGAPMPEFHPYQPVRFEDQARVLLDAKVPVFSFICGIPPREILDECRRQRVATIGSATTPDEARALEQAGVDAIVASGFEGGGHRGSFLRSSESSLTGTFALVPQVVDAVRVPVIAAGGIADARGVVAALALGAHGVQLGTAFLPSPDSGATALHRAALAGPEAAHTLLTRGVTGRLARGIETAWMEELARPETKVLPYPLQRALVKSLTTAAERAGRPELVPMWAGQSARLSHRPDSIAFLQELVDAVSAFTR